MIRVKWTETETFIFSNQTQPYPYRHQLNGPVLYKSMSLINVAQQNITTVQNDVKIAVTLAFNVLGLLSGPHTHIEHKRPECIPFYFLMNLGRHLGPSYHGSTSFFYNSTFAPHLYLSRNYFLLSSLFQRLEGEKMLNYHARRALAF